VDVCLIEPKPGLPDMVFTANAGFVWKEKFIVSNFRHEVRRGETAYYQKWFALRGFEMLHLLAEEHFEGKGTY
jgi:N-dimethylarginine dimethylaminohydrolase